MKTFSKQPGSQEPTRLVACAVCTADDAVPHWECDGFSFVRCRRCGHIYQNPQPDPSALIARYDQEYADYEVENSSNFLSLMLKGLADVDLLRRVEEAGVEWSVLDIGCATGALLEHLRGLGFDVQGVEVCVPAAEYGREKRGVPIEIGTIDTVDFEPRRFGVVHASHLIEHVPDTRKFLRELRDLVLPGGFAVVVTPNTSGLQAQIFGARWRSAIADHVHLFNLRNLRWLAQQEGFSVVATKTWGGLGVGTAPTWLKRPADVLAKAMGFGDVMLLLLTRQRADGQS